MRRLVLALLVCACSCPPKKPEATGPPPVATPTPTPAPPASAPVATALRVRAVAPGHPLYARVEGTEFKNACSDDAACKVGGCGGEVCSAEEGIMTSCEAQSWPQKGAACGCVAGECVWYRATGAQGMPCPDGKCAAGLSCIRYFGVAGPSGPAFASCELPCGLPGASCPEGHACVTVADGPGRICRPTNDAVE